MGRKACVSEAVPPARNGWGGGAYPKSRESLRFGGSAFRPGNVNSPQPRLASVPKNNLAPILRPSWSIAAKISQLYPLRLSRRLECIGNGQQVQIIHDVDRPAERQCSPVWGERWAPISAHLRWRGRQPALFPSVDREHTQPGRVLG